MRGMPLFRLIGRVSSAHEGGGSELGDGYVIRMAVASFRAERDYNLWLQAPNMDDKPVDHLHGIRSIEVTIAEPKQMRLFDSQDGGGTLQFRLPFPTDYIEAGPVVLFAETASLTASGSDKICLDALICIPGKGSTNTERFIIGMSCYTE